MSFFEEQQRNVRRALDSEIKQLKADIERHKALLIRAADALEDKDHVVDLAALRLAKELRKAAE